MDKPNINRPQVAQRPDEIFDVVDLEDRVIAQATRKEVHAKHLLHRAVHVLIHNPRGQVFLQKRSLAKDSHPGRWDSSCSGHLDSGENYADAAARELLEEIGVQAMPAQLKFQLRLTPSAITGWEFVSVFTLPWDGAVILNPAEIDQGQWFDPKALSSEIRDRPNDFTPTLRLHWEAVREKNAW